MGGVRKAARCGFTILLLLTAGAPAGGQELSHPSSSEASSKAQTLSSYCQAMTSTVSQSAAALSQVCEFALSLERRLPSVICSQETKRYRDTGFSGLLLQDTVTAEVNYEHGKEQYRNLAINGKAIASDVPHRYTGWSTGEFASSLYDIFAPPSMAEFKFKKKEVVRATPTLVFQFHIKHENNPFWFLEVGRAKVYPGYSGRLWIDEASSHLMRLEVGDIEVDRHFPLQRVSSIIDYAEIQLGDGTSFDLPVKSETVACGSAMRSSCTQNILKFSNWRKFVATARILSDAGSQPGQAMTMGYVPADTLAQLELEEKDKEYARFDEMLASDHAQTESEPPQATVATANAGPAKPGASISPPTQRAPDSAPVPDSGQAASSDTPAVPTFKVDVKLVLVRVVARDGEGHAIGDLQLEDFELFDKSKPQVISHFSVRKVDQSRAASGQSLPTPGGNTPAPAERYVAYVFDDVHIALGDLAHARDAFEGQLASLEPGDRAAILTTSRKTLLDFTADRAKLRQTAELLKPNPSSMAGQHGCPHMSYYLADLIENKHDPEAIQGATRDAAACGVSARFAGQIVSGAARQQLAIGERESRDSLAVLKEIVQGMAGMSGPRSIVLVSPGFLTSQLSYEYSEVVDRAVRSQIVINALDARGVFVPVNGGDASVRRWTSSPSSFGNQEVLEESDVLRALADGTGGMLFHNSNDLTEGFRRLAGVPEYSYLLGFAPQNLKPDGKFHDLKVKLKSPQKLTLQARRGYYAPNRNGDTPAK